MSKTLNTQKVYSNDNFIKEVAEILGDNFFLTDMIGQEELFQYQGQLSSVVCSYANNGNKLALAFTKMLPNTFYTS